MSFYVHGFRQRFYLLNKSLLLTTAEFLQQSSYLEKGNENYKPFAHILRSAIAYGAHYKYLNHSKKNRF
jgi:hypothetical protein